MLNALAEEVACRGEFSEGALVSGEGLVTFHHVVEQQGGRSKPAPTRRGSWASSAGLLAAGRTLPDAATMDWGVGNGIS